MKQSLAVFKKRLEIGYYYFSFVKGGIELFRNVECDNINFKRPWRGCGSTSITIERELHPSLTCSQIVISVYCHVYDNCRQIDFWSITFFLIFSTLALMA